MTGFIVFLFILMIPFFYKSAFKMNLKLIGVYTFLILIREVVATINVYFFKLPGSKGDARVFHEMAEIIASTGEYSFELGHLAFADFLGFIYRVSEVSFMLGHQLSILAFSLSCVVLLKIVSVLDFERYKVQTLLVYGSLPSVVLNGTFVLRESYEVLFMMMAVYFGIKLIKNNRNVLFNFSFLISLILMGVLHRALMAYAFFLLFIFIWWSTIRTETLNKSKKRIAAVIYTFLILALIPFLGAVFKDVMFMFYNFSVIDSIVYHRENTIVSNASYEVSLNPSNLISFVFSFLKIYFYYLFAPFLWNISNFYDVYAVSESIIRMILIYCSIKIWRESYGENKSYLFLMLLIFVGISFLWSVGTVNYGTAIRHRMMDWWIISILGTPYLVRYFRRIFKYIFR
jgi:hypothetical protein